MNTQVISGINCQRYERCEPFQVLKQILGEYSAHEKHRPYHLFTWKQTLKQTETTQASTADASIQQP